MSITKSSGSYLKQIERLKGALDSADVVVGGAGAGLSTSAGFVYAGERFQEHFADFETKYGFHDMYSGAFCRYNTPEEHWAYWSRFITVNRYVDPPKPVYREILELVKDKDYFVITTNVDHCFQKAGFDKKRLFYTQGDYGLFQCSEPCCQETFDNEGVIKAMMEQQRNMRIPSSLMGDNMKLEQAIFHMTEVMLRDLGMQNIVDEASKIMERPLWLTNLNYHFLTNPGAIYPVNEKLMESYRFGMIEKERLLYLHHKKITDAINRNKGPYVYFDEILNTLACRMLYYFIAPPDNKFEPLKPF